MKNITVSLPTEVYHRVRMKAAEQGTSVSALVREFLELLGDEESDFTRRKRVQDDVLESIRRFQARNRLKRDEIHRRGGSR